MKVMLQPHRKFHQILHDETFEPLISHGLRMGIAAVVPLTWGLITGNILEASWMTLTAECICWVELKGSFPHRLRALLSATLLTLVFGILGTVTATSLWWSVITIVFVGFFAGMIKNLGDRGSGLAVCVQVLFIITNAYPTEALSAIQSRTLYILIGGTWAFTTGILASLFYSPQQPYRRTIALIWRANARLTETFAKGWDVHSPRSSIREIYLKEKDVQKNIDHSYAFFESMAHEVKKSDREIYHLAQLRKATALIATHIIAIGTELESVKIREVEENYRENLFDLLITLSQAMERMGIFVVTRKPEEELLIDSKFIRLKKLTGFLKENLPDLPGDQQGSFRRAIHLIERMLRLTEQAVKWLNGVGREQPVFKTYPLFKTLVVLHPGGLIRNLKVIFNLNSNNTRYALCSALAAALGMFLYKWIGINHGYWLPFTAMIVVQPYFTATLQKAIDRVVGTLAGGVFGGLLIRLPATTYAKEVMLFISLLMMVYFIRKKYAVAVFFITVNLVLLFDVRGSMDTPLIITRALCTIGGAGLGILAGYTLLPVWDKKALPGYIGEALRSNYDYFIMTFYHPKSTMPWTRSQRNAETRNTNAFDSFNRFLSEPSSGERKTWLAYYQIINHNIRLTRLLNEIHLETEDNSEEQQYVPLDENLLEQCQDWFHRNLTELRNLDRTTEIQPIDPMPDARMKSLTTVQHVLLQRILIELKTLHQDFLHIRRAGGSSPASFVVSQS